jgi:chromosome condensin MukBEF ATPase and DNA-binding subunit MukB
LYSQGIDTPVKKLSIKLNDNVRDNFCRTQRTLESRLTMDDDKMTILEQQVKLLKSASADYERKYEEVIVITGEVKVRECRSYSVVGNVFFSDHG